MRWACALWRWPWLVVCVSPPDEAIVVLFPVCAQTWSFCQFVFVCYCLLGFAGVWLFISHAFELFKSGTSNTINSLFVVLIGTSPGPVLFYRVVSAFILCVSTICVDLHLARRFAYFMSVLPLKHCCCCCMTSACAYWPSI